MTPPDRLRTLLARPGILVMPGCHDAISARLIEEAGFELGFMSGFAVSAARLGMPDTGLIARVHCGAYAHERFVSSDNRLAFGMAAPLRRDLIFEHDRGKPGRVVPVYPSV